MSKIGGREQGRHRGNEKLGCGTLQDAVGSVVKGATIEVGSREAVYHTAVHWHHLYRWSFIFVLEYG